MRVELLGQNIRSEHPRRSVYAYLYMVFKIGIGFGYRGWRLYCACSRRAKCTLAVQTHVFNHSGSMESDNAIASVHCPPPYPLVHLTNWLKNLPNPSHVHFLIPHITSPVDLHVACFIVEGKIKQVMVHRWSPCALPIRSTELGMLMENSQPLPKTRFLICKSCGGSRCPATIMLCSSTSPGLLFQSIASGASMNSAAL